MKCKSWYLSLIVSIFFGLRVSEDEIFQFCKNTVLISWEHTFLLHENIFFFVIYCFNKHHLIYFPGNDLGFIILK